VFNTVICSKSGIKLEKSRRCRSVRYTSKRLILSNVNNACDMLRMRTLLLQDPSGHDIQKCYKMHCGVRLHGRNACYVIFWNITPKHWIYMDTGYCNSDEIF
jgi:hypothetical protein